MICKSHFEYQGQKKVQTTLRHFKSLHCLAGANLFPTFIFYAFLCFPFIHTKHPTQHLWYAASGVAFIDQGDSFTFIIPFGCRLDQVTFF